MFSDQNGATFVRFSDEFGDLVIHYVSTCFTATTIVASQFHQWWTTKFHMNPDDMGNDMKMQIMNFMIWKNFHVNFNLCPVNFHILPLANGTLNHWAAPFKVPCLSWTPESLLEMVRCLRDSFFNLDGWAWKWCWKKMMLGNFICLHHDFFWDAAGNCTPKHPRCAKSMFMAIGPLKVIETCTEFRQSHMWNSCFHEIKWCLTTIAACFHEVG